MKKNLFLILLLSLVCLSCKKDDDKETGPSDYFQLHTKTVQLNSAFYILREEYSNKILGVTIINAAALGSVSLQFHDEDGMNEIPTGEYNLESSSNTEMPPVYISTVYDKVSYFITKGVLSVSKKNNVYTMELKDAKVKTSDYLNPIDKNKEYNFSLKYSGNIPKKY
ncbi:MAG: hypothetical protein ACEPOV_14745 [Hyphomicrobiales bacterium]